MANKAEQTRLAKYMPACFKEKCPVCGTPWTVHYVNRKMQIECRACDADRRIQSEPVVWPAVSGCFVSNNADAWEMLWREYVMWFGLQGGLVRMLSAELRQWAAKNRIQSKFDEVGLKWLWRNATEGRETCWNGAFDTLQLAIEHARACDGKSLPHALPVASIPVNVTPAEASHV